VSLFCALLTVKVKIKLKAIYKISDGVRLGYAYDYIVSDLKVATPSSHEFIVLFDLNFPKKVSSSPRYF